MSTKLIEGKVVFDKKKSGLYGKFQGKSIKNPNGKGPKKEFQIYLGKVVDKNALCFFTKEDGLFIFDPNTQTKMRPVGLNLKIENFTQALIAWNAIVTKFNNVSNNKSTGSVVHIPTQLNPEQPEKPDQECPIQPVRFGITFFFNSLLTETGYISSVLSNIPCLSSATLLALVIYKIGCNDTYSNALD